MNPEDEIIGGQKKQIEAANLSGKREQGTAPLQEHPADWGVCVNPRSPRCGLLTFEHQGCQFFEEDPELEKEIEAQIAEMIKPGKLPKK